jgi:hypothetical protein
MYRLLKEFINEGVLRNNLIKLNPRRGVLKKLTVAHLIKKFLTV